MSESFSILVTEKTKELVSKRTQKPFTLTEAWVQVPGDPYPSKIDLFGELKPGKYKVPSVIEVTNGRLEIRLDMDRAQLVKAAE